MSRNPVCRYLNTSPSFTGHSDPCNGQTSYSMLEMVSLVISKLHLLSGVHSSSKTKPWRKEALMNIQGRKILCQGFLGIKKRQVVLHVPLLVTTWNGLHLSTQDPWWQPPSPQSWLVRHSNIVFRYRLLPAWCGKTVSTVLSNNNNLHSCLALLEVNPWHCVSLAQAPPHSPTSPTPPSSDRRVAVVGGETSALCR